MARLILSLDNQVLAEYNMTKERYTIGRLPDNDVRIDNPAVSGHHSLIINILNDSFLEDLNSTNGTYVNGKLIKKHALQNGDVITIGHHQLRFADEHTGDAAQDEFDVYEERELARSTRARSRLRLILDHGSRTRAQAFRGVTSIGRCSAPKGCARASRKAPGSFGAVGGAVNWSLRKP